MPLTLAPTCLLVTVLLIGCASTTPSLAWADRVATAAPDAVANQKPVSQGQNSITLLPISPHGAVVGVPYRYDMPHCGIGSPIDVDGSFWDPLDVGPDLTVFDMQSGVFRLTSPTTATFTAANRPVLVLTRHDGAKEFGLCD